MQSFWVLYVEGTNGGQHRKHYDFEEARIEAERLARKEGKVVHLLECKCYVEATVKWEVTI